MVFKDYYKILGLKTNRVTIDEIRNAYREQAKKYHPDKNAGDEAKEEIFKDINEAYNILSNPRSKRRYDFNWNRYIGRKNNNTSKREKKTIKEILADLLFGGISRHKVKETPKPIYGEDITTSVDVTIEQAFFGVNKKLQLKSIQGKDISYSLKIPAGIQDGDRLRIPGQGKTGKNGGKNGDLVVSVKIKNNPNLKLSGQDLIMDMPLRVWEAALGTTKVVNILKEEIKIVIPKCTSSMDTLVIKNKGYKKGNGIRGNLKIVTRIVITEDDFNKGQKQYETLKQLNMK